MARYDFRCRECGDTFEVQRPMANASDPATCPQGHADTVKLMNLVARVGAAAGGGSMPATAPRPPTGGACCGGGCHS